MNRSSVDAREVRLGRHAELRHPARGAAHGPDVARGGNGCDGPDLREIVEWQKGSKVL